MVDSPDKCHKGCKGRPALDRFDSLGRRVWRCLRCGAEESELYKSLSPPTVDRVAVDAQGGPNKLAQLVRDEGLSLADVDPAIRAEVEQCLIDAMTTGDGRE
jgi:hypothetical protein